MHTDSQPKNEPTASVADASQIGGDHYKHVRSSHQHWNMAASHHLSYFPGQVSKYITRHPNKNGLEDVQKAGHYLDKLIELEENGWPPAMDLEEYAQANKLNATQTAICALLTTWERTQDIEQLYTARDLVRGMVGEMDRSER